MGYQDLLSLAKKNLKETEELGKQNPPFFKDDIKYQALLASRKRVVERLRKVGEKVSGIDERIAESDERFEKIGNELSGLYKKLEKRWNGYNILI